MPIHEGTLNYQAMAVQLFDLLGRGEKPTLAQG
jgi:hypothetical protein